MPENYKVNCDKLKTNRNQNYQNEDILGNSFAVTIVYLFFD